MSQLNKMTDDIYIIQERSEEEIYKIEREIREKEQLVQSEEIKKRNQRKI